MHISTLCGLLAYVVSLYGLVWLTEAVRDYYLAERAGREQYRRELGEAARRVAADRSAMRSRRVDTEPSRLVLLRTRR